MMAWTIDLLRKQLEHLARAKGAALVYSNSDLEKLWHQGNFSGYSQGQVAKAIDNIIMDPAPLPKNPIPLIVSYLGKARAAKPAEPPPNDVDREAGELFASCTLLALKLKHDIKFDYVKWCNRLTEQIISNPDLTAVLKHEYESMQSFANINHNLTVKTEERKQKPKPTGAPRPKWMDK